MKSKKEIWKEIDKADLEAESAYIKGNHDLCQFELGRREALNWVLGINQPEIKEVKMYPHFGDQSISEKSKLRPQPMIYRTKSTL